MPTAQTPPPPRWPDIHDLQQQFPSIPIEEIGRILIDARRGVDLFGLPSHEEDAMVVKIAIEELRQRTGQSSAVGSPRLDPEIHHARRISRDADSVAPAIGA